MPKTKPFKVDLGKFTEPAAQRVDTEEILQTLHDHIVYERRFSHLNVRNIMSNSTRLVRMYHLSVPSVEEARRIEQELRKRPGIKDTTIKLYLHAMELIAESQGISLRLAKPKAVYKVREGLSIPEARALLQAALNVRDKAIIALLLFCGIRGGELAGLDLIDVDMRGRLIFIWGRTKNRHERKTLMTRECTQLVEAWVTIRPDLPGNPALFVNVKGGRISVHRVEEVVRDAGKRAGIIKRCYPHMLRHTAATVMLRSGVPITEVALQLGHRNLSSTMTYLHGDLEGLRESLDKRFKY